MAISPQTILSSCLIPLLIKAPMGTTNALYLNYLVLLLIRSLRTMIGVMTSSPQRPYFECLLSFWKLSGSFIVLACAMVVRAFFFIILSRNLTWLYLPRVRHQWSEHRIYLRQLIEHNWGGTVRCSWIPGNWATSPYRRHAFRKWIANPAGQGSRVGWLDRWGWWRYSAYWYWRELSPRWGAWKAGSTRYITGTGDNFHGLLWLSRWFMAHGLHGMSTDIFPFAAKYWLVLDLFFYIHGISIYVSWWGWSLGSPDDRLCGKVTSWMGVPVGINANELSSWFGGGRR